MTVKVIGKENKYRKCSRGLVSFLNKIRDLYVTSMSELANQIDSGCGPRAVNGVILPKSFSMNSRRLSNSDKELAELVRIASRRGLAKKVESEFLRQKRSTHTQTLDMGKIDEDKACDFEGLDGVGLNHVNFPRSRSHVVPKRTNGMF